MVIEMNQNESQPNQPEADPAGASPDQPAPAGAGAPGSDEAPMQAAEPAKIAQFVTSIKNAEQQVGEHVIQALSHQGSVAVLTTVVVGPGGQQHIVSAALDAQKTAQVNALLQGAREERVQEEPCVGFHCLIKPKAEHPPAADDSGE